MTIDERIYNEATAQGMPPILATLIVAQARHETGNYTSSPFIVCNNCFGYKWVGQSTAAGSCINSSENNPYAKYNSIEQSVQELTAWIKRRQRDNHFPQDLRTITTPDQYATLLKNAGYFGAPLSVYINGLLFWLTKIGNLPGAKESAFALMVLISLGIIFWRKKFF